MQNSCLLKHNLAIDADIWSLERIITEKLSFNIPIYQRLYVWEAPQIKTLLEDLAKASEQPGRDYFLGGIMLSPHAGSTGNHFDLIDGQQRMLTLWLLARVLGTGLQPFLQIDNPNGPSSRITFAIRDHINAYFEHSADIPPAGNDPELEPVIRALGIISDWLADEERTLNCSQLGSFIATRLKLNITIMPDYVKGTELFEAMNNRGQQLQHHQILKSLLLNDLPEKDRHGHHLLWEACAGMDSFIEKNIKEISGLPWNELLTGTDEPGLKDTIPDILTKQTSGGTTQIHLLDLLRDPEVITEPQTPNSTADTDYDAGPVESIISFPMLLLHVLRIWLQQTLPQLPADEIPPVHEKQLLQLFDCHFFHLDATDKSITFLKLLWRARVQFDCYIIKWLDKDTNKPLQAISKLYQSEGRLARRASGQNNGFALLQSMLYHSQESITQYWLTPFLARLLQPGSEEDHYLYLRQLDNQLFCTGPQKENLSTRTWHLAGQHWKPSASRLAPLSVSSGTGFSRYWFYKLDFILWYYSQTILPTLSLNETAREQWRQFRMTSRTSVEHVSPQHPEDGDADLVYDPEKDDEQTIKDHLDDFGNLVLVTTSINSSYGRKPYKVKRELFSSNNRMESLKSAVLFQNTDWNYAASSAHRRLMIAHFKAYFTEHQMPEASETETDDPAAGSNA